MEQRRFLNLEAHHHLKGRTRGFVLLFRLLFTPVLLEVFPVRSWRAKKVATQLARNQRVVTNSKSLLQILGGGCFRVGLGLLAIFWCSKGSTLLAQPLVRQKRTPAAIYKSLTVLTCVFGFDHLQIQIQI